MMNKVMVETEDSHLWLMLSLNGEEGVGRGLGEGGRGWKGEGEGGRGKG